MKRIAVILILSGAVMTARTDDNPIIQARRALDAGDAAGAVAILGPAVISHPSNASFRAELALALVEAGQPDEALSSARAAVKAARSAETMRALALVQASRNEMPAARATIAGALKRWPKDGALNAAAGRVAWRDLLTATAIHALEAASGGPSVAVAAEAQLALGEIYAFKGWRAEGAFPGWHEEVDYRPRALAAYRAAAAQRPSWYAPHLALGEALLADGQAAEAVKAFDEALKLAPTVAAASAGRDRAAAAAGGTPPAPPPLADAAVFEKLDASAKAQQTAAVVEQARDYIRTRPYSPRLIDAYDRLLTAYQGAAAAPAADIAAAIDARVALRPDASAYFAGAGALLARSQLLDKVRALAADGRAAGERFIAENRGSYKLPGKVQGSRDRNAAAAADLIGWAAFLQKDQRTARARLDEAARLSNGLDFANQYHLGELARAAGDLDQARERYYSALSLTAGPPPLRDAARKALDAIYDKEGTPAGERDTAVERELDRRREERRKTLVASPLGTSLPGIPVTDTRGTPVDLLAIRGNVTLLNFFASW